MRLESTSIAASLHFSLPPSYLLPPPQFILPLPYFLRPFLLTSSVPSRYFPAPSPRLPPSLPAHFRLIFLLFLITSVASASLSPRLSASLLLRYCLCTFPISAECWWLTEAVITNAYVAHMCSHVQCSIDLHLPPIPPASCWSDQSCEPLGRGSESSEGAPVDGGVFDELRRSVLSGNAAEYSCPCV